MNNFSLACYSIRVKRKKISNPNQKNQKSDVSLTLDGSDGGIDLISFLKDFLQEMSSQAKVDEPQKILMKVLQSVSASPSEIAGIIESGNYGMSSNIVDKTTFKTVHSRERDQAELLPFYFLCSIRPQSDEAILILSRTGTKGIRKDLGKIISKPFENKFLNCEMTISPLVLDVIIEQYLSNGVIKNLKFIKFEISHDLVDSLDENHTEIPISREITYYAKDRNQRFPINIKPLINFLRTPKESRKVNEILELKESDGDYDTIKIEVEIGGLKKIINLGNLSRVRNYFDISNDPQLSLGVNGHPTFDSIDQIAHSYCSKLMEIMYR
jgi:hypothetical protein